VFEAIMQAGMQKNPSCHREAASCVNETET